MFEKNVHLLRKRPNMFLYPLRSVSIAYENTFKDFISVYSIVHVFR